MIAMKDGKNWEVKENKAFVSVNPSLFPVEVVYSAAYCLIDKAYLVIDGDPDEEVEISITVKEDNDADPEELAKEFNNQLLNYGVYVTQAARNQSLRESIVQKALNTNLMTFDEWHEQHPHVHEEKTNYETDRLQDSPEDIEEVKGDYVKDPKGIAEPWSPEDADGLDIDPEELTEGGDSKDEGEN